MATSNEKYIGAIGRRKNATAQVRITPDKKMSFTINDRALDEYFTVAELQKVVQSPFFITERPTDFNVSILVKGGGISAQADAIRHGIARALEKYNEELRAPLKSAGYLKRDPRRKERKKPGLRKARKRPAWSKR